MLYKTMVLELIEQRPRLFEPLRQSRTLLPTVNTYALDLKSRHDYWTERLSTSRPDSDLAQIKSEALELALQGVTDRLQHEFSTDEPEATTIT